MILNVKLYKVNSTKMSQVDTQMPHGLANGFNCGSSPTHRMGNLFPTPVLDLIKFDSSCENQTCFDLVSY